MLLCIVCDFVLLHNSIILSLLMALNMFVGGKFAHPGGGGCDSSWRQKKTVDGRSSIKFEFDNSHFSVKVWYIS